MKRCETRAVHSQRGNRRLSRDYLSTATQAFQIESRSGDAMKPDSHIEEIRKLAKAGDLEQIALRNQIYTKSYPYRGKLLQGRIAGVLVSNYFPTIQNFDFESFINWTLETPNWSIGLRRNCLDGSTLRQQINWIVQSVANFRDGASVHAKYTFEEERTFL